MYFLNIILTVFLIGASLFLLYDAIKNGRSKNYREMFRSLVFTAITLDLLYIYHLPGL